MSVPPAAAAFATMLSIALRAGLKRFACFVIAPRRIGFQYASSLFLAFEPFQAGLKHCRRRRHALGDRGFCQDWRWTTDSHGEAVARFPFETGPSTSLRTGGRESGLNGKGRFSARFLPAFLLVNSF